MTIGIDLDTSCPCISGVDGKVYLVTQDILDKYKLELDALKSEIAYYKDKIAELQSQRDAFNNPFGTPGEDIFSNQVGVSGEGIFDDDEDDYDFGEQDGSDTADLGDGVYASTANIVSVEGFNALIDSNPKLKAYYKNLSKQFDEGVKRFHTDLEQIKKQKQEQEQDTSDVYAFYDTEDDIYRE